MDGLRWLLLLFGLLVIAGVYLYSRREREREQRASDPELAQNRLEPSLNGEFPADEPEPGGAEPDGAEAGEDSAGETVADADTPQSPQSQKILTLRVVASDKKAFAGDELALSLRGVGMRHGKFGIFHRYDGDDENKIIFSAASLVEPGSFDLANLKSQEIPGISLFMVLPGPVDGPQGFDLMLSAARTLSQSLGAELLDESGSTLSIQRERYLREEIIQFQTANLVA